MERSQSALNKKNILFMRYGLLTMAAALTVIGLMRQEQLLVLQKAVKICLECIGIG